ncbi:MAG: hypothetical protein HYR55_03840 [Acidobacteria bacterium]|nr:hypothetical protein [Acidobacteriota bacterium]
MSITVSLCVGALDYPEGGGHLWVYLNWALGLRSLGCRVIWIEPIDAEMPESHVKGLISVLKFHLERYGFSDSVALMSLTGQRLPRSLTDGCLELDAAAEADLMLNMRYDLRPELIGRFRRSALLDIDPGLLQAGLHKGELRLARHDAYFTIGETVGTPGALFPDGGLTWLYTPPCVALDYWKPARVTADAPFTTVSHWYMDEWLTDADGQVRPNDKRSGFLPFLDLPRRTRQPLELALFLDGDAVERSDLQARGWRVREAREVASTPWDYQSYIQSSRGEFSCAKPHCLSLQNAWISDRTLCYLASGKPAVVQHTGPSRFLPDAAGLFRFRTMAEAVSGLEKANADYERQCGLARLLATEHFNAERVVGKLLERALH